jgi:hypothetical protein
VIGIHLHQEKPKTKSKKMSRSLKKSGLSRKQVLALINESREHKFYPYLLSTTVSSTSGLVNFTGLLALGTAENERVGNTVDLKSIDFDITATAGDDRNWLRVIIAMWNGDAGALPVDTDFFQNTSYPIVSPANVDGRLSGAVEFLYDKTVSLLDGSAAGFTVQDAHLKGTVKIPVKQQTIDYSGVTGVDSARRLYLIVVSDSGAIPHVGILGHFTINYLD